MTDVKKQLAKWIDDDRDKIIGFLCDFVRAKSPNPPGDTTLAAAHVTRFLEANGLPFRVIAPQATMPNVVGSFDTGKPGHHLVLNGHMDVFPADAQAEGWTQDPVGRGDRGRQDLRTRRGRHEGGHVGVGLHLLLPPPGARAPEGQADPHRGLRRGDIRSVGCALLDGASSGSPWRLPA